jgi:hypothetical protein
MREGPGKPGLFFGRGCSELSELDDWKNKVCKNLSSSVYDIGIKI